MDENTFLNTMIDVLRYDNVWQESAHSFLPIVSRSKINFLPQWGFVGAGHSNQRWEDAELRVPVPLINVANEISSELTRLCKYVYQESADHAFRNLLIRPLIRQSEIDELVQNEVHFDGIEDTIIQGIRDAKYVVWVAVAWFTNRHIYDELVNRKASGVSIRVITSDEDSNRYLMSELKREFDTVTVPRFGVCGTNRMHDKFCIIDFEYVMHGSYNWSANANLNDETWATSIDRELAKKFADEFQRLYVENKA